MTKVYLLFKSSSFCIVFFLYSFPKLIFLTKFHSDEKERWPAAYSPSRGTPMLFKVEHEEGKFNAGLSLEENRNNNNNKIQPLNNGNFHCSRIFLQLTVSWQTTFLLEKLHATHSQHPHLSAFHTGKCIVGESCWFL